MFFSIHPVLIKTIPFFFPELIYCRNRIAPTILKRIEQNVEMKDDQDKIYIVSFKVNEQKFRQL